MGLFYYSRQADSNELIHILWGHDVVITFVLCCAIQQGITTSIHFFSRAISCMFSCSISDASVSKVILVSIKLLRMTLTDTHHTNTHLCMWVNACCCTCSYSMSEICGCMCDESENEWQPERNMVRLLMRISPASDPMTSLPFWMVSKQEKLAFSRTEEFMC